MKINLRTQIGIFVAISFSLAVCPARAQDWGTPPVKDEIETRVISRARSAPRDFYKFFERVGHTTVMLKDLHLRTVDGQIVRVPRSLTTVDLQDLKSFGKGIAIDMRNVKFPSGTSIIGVVEFDADVGSCYGDGMTIEGSVATCKLCNCTTIRFVSNQVFNLESDQYIIKVDFNPLHDLNVDYFKLVTQLYKCQYIFGTSNGCKAISDGKTEEGYTCELANRRLSITGVVRRADEY